MKAKAEPSWRFWGLDGHVCTMESLREAYRIAKANNGAPGSAGGTLEDIEASGVEPLLEQRQAERVTRTYRPLRLRQKAIPQEGGPPVRVLSMPTIRDRVVQGALKRVLAPIFEADGQPGSYGYRPQRSAQDAVLRVAEAIVQDKTRGIDVDVPAYFDHIRHHRLLAQGAQRVNAPDVLHVLTLVLQASGNKGVAPGGGRSPLRSQLSLTGVDRRRERATEVPPRGASPALA